MTIIDGISLKLRILKYQEQEEDSQLLELLIEKVIDEINNFTNQYYTFETIPSSIKNIVIDRTVGEFLFLKKNSGALLEIDSKGIEKQLQVGDTSITYITEGILTPEQRLDRIINVLLNTGKEDLIKFRRIVW